MWRIIDEMNITLPDPPPDDLPSEKFEVVCPIGTSGPCTLWEAHEIRLATVERGVSSDAETHVVLFQKQ